MKTYRPLTIHDTFASGDEARNSITHDWHPVIALIGVRAGTVFPADQLATEFRRPVEAPDPVVPDHTPEHRALIRELLDSMNARRRRKGRKPVGLGSLPPLTGSAASYYLVDTYRVRRHWRRRPVRNPNA